MYNAILYINSGFDLVNIPDTPALLDTVEHKAVNALDILQNQELTSIRIQASYNDVKNADYINIGGSYYYITGRSMLSNDVCELALNMDYITSAGGIGLIEVESGWLTRACVDDDELFKYTIPEEFVPNEPLKLVGGQYLLNYNGSTDKTLIQSTVNLPALRKVDEELTALTFTGSSRPEDALYIPYCPPVTYETIVGFEWGDPKDQGVKITTTPKSVLFLGEDEDNTKGLSVLRSISAESSILSQYNVPDIFISSNSILSDFGSYRQLISKKFSVSVDLPYIYDNSIKNKKVFCGQYNKYYLISNVSGNKCESLPENLSGGGFNSPQVEISADLRSNGAPFAWFLYKQGMIDYNLQSAVYGLPWQDAPLVYTSKSGSNLDRYNFLSSSYQQAVNTYNNVGMGIFGQVGKALMGGAGVGNQSSISLQKGVQNPITYNINPALQAGSSFGAVNAGNSITSNLFNFDIDRQRATQNFLFNQSYVAPEINFPRQEGIRDFIGNNFLVYKLQLSYNDLVRFDYYLTAFGYKVNLEFDGKYLTTRKNFNYIEASQVHIKIIGGGSLVQRIGIEKQLTGGVRIWHILPTPTAFNDNPIR